MKLRILALLFTAITISTAPILGSQDAMETDDTDLYELACKCDFDGLKKLADTKSQEEWKQLATRRSDATIALASAAIKASEGNKRASNSDNQSQSDQKKYSQEQYVQLFYALQPFYPNVNYFDKDGVTILHRLTKKIDRPSIAFMKPLLNAYPNINYTAQDDEGNTPLHYCARQNKHHQYVCPVANLLIERITKENNQLLDIPNCAGKTPLDLAKQSRHAELIAKLLEERKSTEEKKAQ